MNGYYEGNVYALGIKHFIPKIIIGYPFNLLTKYKVLYSA
jgi:hypothetical protein